MTDEQRQIITDIANLDEATEPLKLVGFIVAELRSYKKYLQRKQEKK